MKVHIRNKRNIKTIYRERRIISFVYSPERKILSIKYQTHNIPNIGGCTKLASIAKSIYSQITEEIIVLSS